MTREYINGDCMEGMKAFPNNHFDLAIVDPPYGINAANGKNTAYASAGKSRRFTRNIQHHSAKEWDLNKPKKEYFTELFRVSKNQIIWGANYFDLPPSSGYIFWDKKITNAKNKNFSDGELAFSSFNRRLIKFTYDWIGFGYLNNPHKERKIHPTQKPVALYRWLLDNYAKPGDLLLDTHVGSASSLIAFEEKGFEYVAFELDKDYYRDSCKRLETWRSQLRLFDPTPEKKEYKQLSIIE